MSLLPFESGLLLVLAISAVLLRLVSSTWNFGFELIGILSDTVLFCSMLWYVANGEWRDRTGDWALLMELGQTDSIAEWHGDLIFKKPRKSKPQSSQPVGLAAYYCMLSRIYSYVFSTVLMKPGVAKDLEVQASYCNIGCCLLLAKRQLPSPLLSRPNHEEKSSKVSYATTDSGAWLMLLHLESAEICQPTPKFALLDSSGSQYLNQSMCYGMYT